MLTAASALVLALLPLASYAQDNNTAAVLQDLMNAKIIPNVIPAFTPVFPFEVVFTDAEGSRFPVTAGANLTINQTAHEPSFGILSNNTHIIGKPYLIAMIDADAPTPQDPSLAQLRHFLGADFISNGSTNGEFTLSNQTQALTEYLGPGPGPTSPPHRYIILCYLQNSVGVTPPADFNVTTRTNFNITSFVDNVHGNNFTLVGATFFFVSANDTTGSVAPNSTTGNPPVASGTSPTSASPSGSGSNGTIKLGAAVAWSVVGVLSATGALFM